MLSRRSATDAIPVAFIPVVHLEPVKLMDTGRRCCKTQCSLIYSTTEAAVYNRELSMQVSQGVARPLTSRRIRRANVPLECTSRCAK